MQPGFLLVPLDKLFDGLTEQVASLQSVSFGDAIQLLHVGCVDIKVRYLQHVMIVDTVYNKPTVNGTVEADIIKRQPFHGAEREKVDNAR